MSRKIIYKTPEQINNIREAGKRLTELLLLLQGKAAPGISGIQLEAIASDFLEQRNLIGAFKGYGGFPANLCISINDCIVHGIPDKTVLMEGDLLKIDAGVMYQGGVADAAISLIVGGKEYNKKGRHLIETTKGALDHSLSCVQPGMSMFTYGKAVHEYVTKRNCSIIKNLTGHGVGVEVHEGPSIYNRPHGSMQQYTFQPGMVIALEPITAIKSSVYIEKPGTPRNIYTKKGDLGAQWEYTIAITDTGYDILAGVTSI